MSRGARRWCLGWAAVVVVVTTVPYTAGFAAAGGEWAFSGFVFGVEDGNSYIAKMRLGAEGEWLFRTPYTTQPQHGVIAFLPYLLLGKLASPPAVHEQLVALFHLARALAVPLEVFATYRLACLFVADERWRRWSVVMATVGGGLGWLLILLGQSTWLGSLPLEFYSPESFGFLALYGLPHLVVGRALMLMGLVKYLEALGRRQAAWPAGLLWFALGMVQPLQVASVLAIVGAHGVALGVVALLRREAAQFGAWAESVWPAGLLALAPLLYTGAAFLRDPYLRAWSDQNRILSPHPLHYLVAYAAVALPAALGARRLIRQTSGLLLAVWVGLLPLLAYAPVNVQRRLPEGVWVALCVLAAAALERGGGQRRLRARWEAALLAVSLPSTLLLLAGGMRTAIRPSPPAFVPAAEVQALAWLEANARLGDVVLASYPTGNLLPAWAPVRVIIGHGPESASLEQLRPEVEAVFDGDTSDDHRLAMLRAHDVAFVFYGPEEQSLGSWDPDSARYVALAWDQGDYRVYRVTAGGN